MLATVARNVRSGDPAEEVHTLLRRIIHAVDLHSRRVERQSGLTTPQAVVLRAVAAQGRGTTRALAAEVSLSQATVTLILDKLASKKLLERYRSAGDRRVMHARLTPAGRRVLRRLPPLLHESFRNEFAGLDADRRDALVASLRALAAMVEGHEGARAPGDSAQRSARRTRTSMEDS